MAHEQDKQTLPHDGDIDYLPVSMVAEAVYCPRNVYYRMVECWESLISAEMLRGRLEEERRNRREKEYRGEKHLVRSVTVSSERLRLIAVIDAVEEGAREDGTPWLRPVEYKTGSLPQDESPALRFPEFEVRPEHVQLCAQAMLLEEHSGQSIDRGYVYYTRSRTRVEVDFTEALRAKVHRAIAWVWQILDAVRPPRPVADARCPGCSFFVHCQPGEVRRLNGEASALPRVLPPDALARTLYVDMQGAMVRKRGGELVIDAPEKNGERASTTRPLLSVEQLVLIGAVQVTTQALQALQYQGVDVVFMTTRGRFLSRLAPATSPNAHVRLAQYAAQQDPVRAMEHARQFVSGKLHNMRTLLLRYARSGGSEDIQKAAHAIRAMQRRVPNVSDRASLMGLEGQGTRAFFSVFDQLLRGGGGAFSFEKRTRRPPRDPVNALLGFAYSLLLADLMAACQAAGLDPYVGFLHTPRYGRPALALDLMEEFRPVVADSVVLTLVNKNMIRPEHFEEKMGGVFLNEGGREVFYRAYSQRKHEHVVHPHFGYQMQYHRAFAAQARLLAKVCTGDVPLYKPFTVR